MQLEQVEQRCLDYLKQTSNPLTPFSRLLRHVQEEEAFAGVDEQQLMDFLRRHDLFRVLEPIGLATTEEGRRIMEEAGLQTEPMVILETRLPTEAQLSAYLREQVDTLMDALQKAGEEARRQGDVNRLRAIENLLARSESLRERLGAL